MMSKGCVGIVRAAIRCTCASCSCCCICPQLWEVELPCLQTSGEEVPNDVPRSGLELAPVCQCLGLFVEFSRIPAKRSPPDGSPQALCFCRINSPDVHEAMQPNRHVAPRVDLFFQAVVLQVVT